MSETLVHAEKQSTKKRCQTCSRSEPDTRQQERNRREDSTGTSTKELTTISRKLRISNSVETRDSGGNLLCVSSCQSCCSLSRLQNELSSQKLSQECYRNPDRSRFTNSHLFKRRWIVILESDLINKQAHVTHTFTHTSQLKQCSQNY